MLEMKRKRKNNETDDIMSVNTQKSRSGLLIIRVNKWT